MQRRKLALLYAFATTLLTAPHVTGDAAPSNFVVFLADDMGWGDLGVQGHPQMKTPNLDRFATQGLRLTQCYSASSVCSPSRSAILTGRTPYRNGVFTWIPAGNEVHLRRSERSIAVLLGERGYETCHVGKWHLNGKFNSSEQPQPGDHGYDWWLATQNNAAPSHRNPRNFVRNGEAVGELEGFSAVLVVDEAIRWLRRERKGGKPFLLSVWTHEPHLPIESDPRFMELYDEIEDEGLRQHHGNITQTDFAFGKLMRTLDELGLEKDTLVFFTSDNGPEGKGTSGRTRGSTGGLRGRKRSLYEGGIRVPGLVRWPGRIAPGSTSDTPVIGSDIFSTLCAVAGVQPPADRTIDGVSLLPLFSGEALARKQPLYWRYHGAPGELKIAMRDGDWKLLANAELSRFELFRIPGDHEEKRELSAEEPERLARLRERLVRFNEAVEKEGPDWWRSAGRGKKRRGVAARRSKAAPLPEGRDETGTFAAVRGCRVRSEGKAIVVDAEGEGFAVKKLPSPIRGRATVKLAYRSLAQSRTRNAFLAFGKTATNADLVKCGSAIGMGAHAIFHGQWSNINLGPLAVAKLDPAGSFEVIVDIDVDRGKVSLRVGETRVNAALPRDLDEIRYLGFYAKATSTAFDPLEILSSSGGEKSLKISADSAAREDFIRAAYAVGREGSGNEAVSRAWRTLVDPGAPGDIVPVLAAMKGASPLCANWLRGAADALAEKASKRGALPLAALERFVLDLDGDPRARRFAFEWIRRVDETATDRLIPGMLDDPSVELRREAVERVIKAAGSSESRGDSDAAVALFQKALDSARDLDQINRVAKKLEDLGETVDLVEHFGFLQSWSIVGPFDNRGNVGYHAVLSPEMKLDLEASYKGREGLISWKPHVGTEKLGTIDLNKVLVEEKGVAAFAHTRFESANARELELRVATTNAFKVWVNGKLVFARNEYHHGTEIDHYRIPVEVRKGRNDLLMKVCQNEQTESWTKNWRFQIRVCDSTGTAVRSTGAADRVKEGGFAALLALLLALLVSFGAPLRASDWTQFRGPGARSVAGADDDRSGVLPVEWGNQKNVGWKVGLPGRGLSSPVISAGRVFVTANSGVRKDRLHVLAFDAKTGERLWERQFWATGRTQCHPKTSMAAPTPVIRDSRLFALFSSNDVVCLDLDGNLLWLRGLNQDYPDASNAVGMASSPIVVGETFVAQLENDGDSFAIGIEVATGKNRWRVARPAAVNWCSPVAIRSAGRDLVLLQAGKGLAALEPRSGRQVWSVELGCSAIPSTTPADETLYVPAGGLTALKVSQSEEGASGPKQLWQTNRLRMSTSSPVVYRGQVYTIAGSVLKCGDAATGELAWQIRLEGAFSATPVAAGGHLYAFNEAGACQVVRLGGARGEIVASNELGESILCSPAIADGAIFVRSDSALWRIERR